jgi:O-antigen/teichoic acid export membrane protein
MKKKWILLIREIKDNVLLSKILLAFVSQGLGIAFQFLFLIVAGRTLEESIYGQVVYVYTILSLIMILTKFGFENGMISLIARKDINIEKKRWCILFCLKFVTALSIFVIAFLWFAHPVVNFFMGNGKSNYYLLKWMAPIILLESWAMIIASVIRGLKKIMPYYIVYMHIQYGVRTVIFLVLFHFFNIGGLVSIVVSYYCSCMIMIVCGLWFLREIHLFSGIKTRYSVLTLLGLAVTLLLSDAVVVINNQIDQYMIGYMMDSSQLAIYSMAHNIGKVSSFALVAVNSIFAPMISEYYYGGRIHELNKLYSVFTKWVVVFNVLTAGIISICAEDVLMIAGSKYVAGKSVLIIIFVGQLASSLAGAAGFLNSMTGRPRYVMYAALSGICVNIALNSLLIPEWGIRGAAIATASAMTIDIIVNFILMYRYLHIHPYHYKYLGIMLSFLMAFMPTYFLHRILNVNFVLKMVICGIVYFLVYAVCTYILVTTSEEKLRIRNMFRNDRHR